MNVGAALQELVFRISDALLWPTVLLLLYGVGTAAFLAGEALAEALRRRGDALAIPDPDAPSGAMAKRRGVSLYAAERRRDPTASAWLALDRTEALLTRRVDAARLWVRMGPALGLAGTLIPLGPALLALAANDLKGLSQGLIVAFGTTVIGIFAGGIAWVVALARERWYALDLAEVRHALEARESRAARA